MSYGNDQSREPPLACLRSAATTFYLDEYKTKLGRGRAMDITLSTSKSISSKHAVIEIGQDGKTAILRDLNSLNGTFVNNTRVHNSTCKLKSNDRIRFGCDVVSYLFQFRNDMQEYSPNRGEKGAKRTPQNRGERAGKRNEYGESLDLGNDPRASTIVCAPRQGEAGAPAKTRSQYDGPGGSGNYSYAGNDGSLSPDALLRAMSHARQDGERLGKWSAEFDDMKRRLKQVEAREDALESFGRKLENGSGSKGVRAGGVGVRTSMMGWTTAAWKMRSRITLTTLTGAIPMQTCLCTTAQKVLSESAAPLGWESEGVDKMRP